MASITPKIKKGSVIREYKYGTYIESTVITDVEVVDGKLKFISETKDGAQIPYLKYEDSLVLMDNSQEKLPTTFTLTVNHHKVDRAGQEFSEEISDSVEESYSSKYKLCEALRALLITGLSDENNMSLSELVAEPPFTDVDFDGSLTSFIGQVFWTVDVTQIANALVMITRGAVSASVKTS